MSKFFNDTLKGLLEAVEIEKNEQQSEGKFAKININIKEEIEKQRENDPEFRKVWDKLKAKK